MKSDVQNKNNSVEKNNVRLKSNISVLFRVAIFILRFENCWNKTGVLVQNILNRSVGYVF